MKRIFLYLCISALIFSCSSNDDSQTSNQPETNFYALKVGNSWVYKNYRFNNQTETYDDIGVIDSVSIVGTEALNGNTYYKFRRWTTGNEEGIALCNPNGEHFELLRDSLGFLVYDDGRIKYINNFFDELMIDSHEWGDIYYHLQEGTQVINTEAGVFDSIEVLKYAYLGSNNELSLGQERYNYSNGIGRVFNTLSLVSNPVHIIEQRLESYIIID